MVKKWPTILTFLSSLEKGSRSYKKPMGFCLSFFMTT